MANELFDLLSKQLIAKEEWKNNFENLVDYVKKNDQAKWKQNNQTYFTVLLEKQRMANVVWEKLLDQIKEQLAVEEGVGLDAALLIQLESLHKAQESFLTSFLNDASLPQCKLQELSLETMFSEDQLAYDSEVSGIGSKEYRDALAKNGSGSEMVQLATEELRTKRESLDKLNNLKSEGAINFMDVVDGLKEWKGIIDELQALALEVGIQLADMLLPLFYMISMSDGIVQEKLMAFHLFITKLKEARDGELLLQSIDAILVMAEMELKEGKHEGRYVEIHTKWYGSEERIDSLLCEVAQLILNGGSLLIARTLPEEPVLLKESLGLLKRRLSKVKEMITLARNDVEALKQQFAKGAVVEEFVAEVKCAIDAEGIWKKLLPMK